MWYLDPDGCDECDCGSLEAEWHLHSPFTPDTVYDTPHEWQVYFAEIAGHLSRSGSLWTSAQLLGFMRGLQIPCLKFFINEDSGILYVALPKYYRNKMAPDILREAPPNSFAAEGESLEDMLQDVDDDEAVTLEYRRSIPFIKMRRYERKDIN